MFCNYPGGMGIPGRKYSSVSGYRYGFNGKENDNEVKGEGNQQDYGMRIYDPRLGRFLSVDPLRREYPQLTPYQFAGNTPVQAIDLDGGEPNFVIGFVVGALTEIVSQTISNGFENLEDGGSFFDGWTDKIDWVDVAISGVQGAMSTVGGGGLGKEIISETIGGAYKSAVDYKVDGGLKNIFDGSMSQDEWLTNVAANTVGSVTGGAPVGDVVEKAVISKTSSTIAKTSAKVIAKSTVNGVRTGMYQTATTTSIKSAKASKSTNYKKDTPNKAPSNNSTNSKPELKKAMPKLSAEERQKKANEHYWKHGRIKIKDKDGNVIGDKHNPKYTSPY